MITYLPVVPRHNISDVKHSIVLPLAQRDALRESCKPFISGESGGKRIKWKYSAPKRAEDKVVEEREVLDQTEQFYELFSVNKIVHWAIVLLPNNSR